MKRILGIVMIAMLSSVTMAAEPSLFGALLNAADKATPKVWQYEEKKDDFEGMSYKTARLRPLEKVKLLGALDREKAELVLVILGAKAGQSVMLSTSSGLLNCTAVSCDVRIKFDDSPPISYVAKPQGDSFKALSFSGDDSNALIQKMLESKQMIVRMEYYQNGPMDFTYKVEGLKLDGK